MISNDEIDEQIDRGNEPDVTFSEPELLCAAEHYDEDISYQPDP